MKLQMIGLGLAAAVALCGLSAQAAEPGARVEVPITFTQLQDGTPRYSIPIVVGGTTVVGELDSGSTGVRILPGTLPAGSFAADGKAEVYSFGSGAEYAGIIAHAPMEIGGLTNGKPVAFQAIETVSCTQDKPQCMAGRVPLKSYGIAGNGVAGQGYKAIIGINMASANAANPLLGVGVTRWIIVLPRPGDKAPGKLILNPSAEEMQGYSTFAIQPRFAGSQGGLHDAVWGCLNNERTNATLCGPFLLDTGGDGIAVTVGEGKSSQPWGPGVPVIMAIGSETKQSLAIRFTTGEGSASRVHFNPTEGQPNSRIMAGPLPYYAYQALYDAKTGTIGLKAR